MLKTVVYLHGFLSSPASAKARATAAAALGRGVACVVPDLNVEPLSVRPLIEQCFRGLDPAETAVVGSSLGGFYALWAAERFGCRAVALNPAVSPWRVVGDYLGEQRIHGTGRTLVVRPEHAEMLRGMRARPSDDPARLLAVLATGDEVLDWREADAMLAPGVAVRIAGGDHQLTGYGRAAGAVLDFCAGGDAEGARRAVRDALQAHAAGRQQV